MGSVVEPARKFFMTHTRAELLEGALKHHAMLYPVSTTADILESVQLAAREFWVELEHAELGTTITYPGAFTKASEAPLRVSRRAPLIGEHNQEILEQEPGLSREIPSTPKQTGSNLAKPNKKGQNRGRKLLEGIKVADFTWNAAAPIAIKTLCDYGAEVIKIEGRSKPDFQRILASFKDGIPGLNRSGDWNRWNTGKLSVALDLTHPKGVEIAKRFVARADIVAENFAGGVMERMGLGYQELIKVKPDIIMLGSSMMGQTGPYATHPGFGNHLTAISGFVNITGWPDREPTPPDGPYTDFIAPRFSLLAIVAALDYRRRTGKGQYLDFSQYESSLHFMAPLILDRTINQRTAGRVGNRSAYAAPHNAYRCLGEDRWCAIAVFTDEEWQSFCRVIGGPVWTDDAKFSTLPARKQNEEELDRLVEEWTISYPPEEVMNMMQAAGVAAGVLENGEDLLEHDRQLKHRHSFWELDHPEVGMHRVAGPSFVLSKSPYELRRAPLLGEHSEYALKEVLGLTDEEIAELVIEGVVE
jgi:benzylsuccinate CoA-transferase BbsF subunit